MNSLGARLELALYIDEKNPRVSLEIRPPR